MTIHQEISGLRDLGTCSILISIWGTLTVFMTVQSSVLMTVVFLSLCLTGFIIGYSFLRQAKKLEKSLLDEI